MPSMADLTEFRAPLWLEVRSIRIYRSIGKSALGATLMVKFLGSPVVMYRILCIVCARARVFVCVYVCVCVCVCVCACACPRPLDVIHMLYNVIHSVHCQWYCYEPKQNIITD